MMTEPTPGAAIRLLTTTPPRTSRVSSTMCGSAALPPTKIGGSGAYTVVGVVAAVDPMVSNSLTASLRLAAQRAMNATSVKMVAIVTRRRSVEFMRLRRG